MPHLQNSDSMVALNINDNDSASRDDVSHKNDILQKALERIGLPLSDDGTENSGVTEILFIIFFWGFIRTWVTFVSQISGTENKIKQKNEVPAPLLL